MAASGQPDHCRNPCVSRRACRRARRDCRGLGAGADRCAWRHDGHTRRHGPARARFLLDQPRIRRSRRGHFCGGAHQAQPYSSGGFHRDCLRRGLRRHHPGHEQGHRRNRAPEGHARREHPGGFQGSSVAHGGALCCRRLFHYIFRKNFLLISTEPKAAEAKGMSIRFWDFLFYVSFGFVVTRSVAIAGVLMVFCYLIVPSVGAMLFADRIGPRLAISWTMGTLVSALGVYLSVVLDLPTGATIVCTFGIVLVLMFFVHLMVHHGSRARALEGARSAALGDRGVALRGRGGAP